MAKSSLTENELVTSHIQLLDAAIIPIVEAIRHILLSAHNDIAERIKWNNPSFYFTGEMADLNPNEFK